MAIAHKSVGSQRCTFEVWDGDIDEEEVRAHILRLGDTATAQRAAVS